MKILNKFENTTHILFRTGRVGVVFKNNKSIVGMILFAAQSIYHEWLLTRDYNLAEETREKKVHRDDTE